MSSLSMSDLQYRRVMLILCYVVYGLLGLVLGMRTNIFLFVQRDYLDSYQHIATLILVSGICMQLTLLLTGYLIEKVGFYFMLVLGVAVSALPLLLMLFVGSAAGFDLGFTAFMLGYGILVLVLNLFVSHLVPGRKGNALLMLHLYFSIGALCGPRLISWCTDAGMPWQQVLSVASVPLIFVFTVLIIAGRFRGAEDNGELSFDGNMASAESNLRGSLKELKDPFLWLFIIVFICSQIWEYGIGTWFVIFANQSRGLSSTDAALYLTLFYASYPLIRILFSMIIHHLNLFAVLLGAFLCCIIWGGLGVISGRLFFYSLTGMGVALMYPGIMAAMQHVFGEGATKKIGFITMAGGIIQYAAIWSVGLLSDRWGIGKGFTSMLGYLVVGAAAAAVILLKVKTGRSELYGKKQRQA